MRNVGTADRWARAAAASAAGIAGLLLVAWPWWARVGLGATAVYLLGTALAGSCLGYRLIGRSTCPVSRTT